MDLLAPNIEATISSHKNMVLSVCFSPDQTKLCSAGSGKNVILTNLQNYKTQKIFTGHERPIMGSDFSSDGNFLATVSVDKTARIWIVESENGNCIKLEGHSNFVWCVRYFHKDPMKVISGSWDKTIKIWDIERKKEISTLDGLEGGSVRSVDILPDNQTIVSGQYNDQLRIWDFRSGKCVQILEQKDTVFSVQFHPRTFSLASGSADNTIKIFDFRTFRLLQNYQEHSESVTSVCFHPSGKVFGCGSADKTIKLFDLSEKKVLYTLKGHLKTVSSVQFSPDGKSFVSASSDKKVFLWNFPLGKMIRDYNKDIDEEERVKYMIQQDLLFENSEDDDCCERNVLKILIRIDDFCDLYCYKFLFV